MSNLEVVFLHEWAFLLTVKQDTVKSCNRILDMNGLTC
jgi:hypothetical protein